MYQNHKNQIALNSGKTYKLEDYECDFYRFQPEQCNREVIDNPYCTLCNACNICYTCLDAPYSNKKTCPTQKMSSAGNKKTCPTKKMSPAGNCASKRNNNNNKNVLNECRNLPKTTHKRTRRDSTAETDSEMGECEKCYFLCGMCAGPGEENLWFKPIYSKNIPKLNNSEQALYEIKPRRKNSRENFLNNKFPSTIRIFMPVDIQKVSTTSIQFRRQEKLPSGNKKDKTADRWRDKKTEDDKIVPKSSHHSSHQSSSSTRLKGVKRHACTILHPSNNMKQSDRRGFTQSLHRTITNADLRINPGSIVQDSLDSLDDSFQNDFEKETTMTMYADKA